MNAIANKTDAQIRTALKTIFGEKCARITRNGEVHVKGVMPNTSQTGWYLMGFTGNAEIEEKIWFPDGSLNTSLAK